MFVVIGATSHAARRALPALIRLLQRGLVSGGDVAEMFSLYRRVFSLQALVAGQEYGFEAFGRQEDVPEDWMNAHRAVSHADPAPNWLMNAPVGSVYRAATLGSRRLAIGELFYGYGWRDCAVTLMPVPLGGPFWLGLYRRQGAKPFDDDESTLVSLLHPHLSAALTARSALAAVKADSGERLEGALDRFEGHAFVSLPGPTLVWSRRARTLIGELLGHPASRLEWQRLERAVGDLAQRFVENPARGRSTRFGPGLRVEFAAVPPEKGEKRRLVLLFMREGPHELASPLLSLLAGRQRQIALGAAAGRSLQSLANELGISRETARTHLRAVYRRLGVSTRAELSALLSASAGRE